MANEVLQNPEQFLPLLQIGLTENNATGSRACWVLEFVCKADLCRLYPYLDIFCDKLPGVTPESSIRPLAKICEILLESYYKKPYSGEPPPLEVWHREALTAKCFDWLINPVRAATKAYSLQCLYLLGTEASWIHDELLGITERFYAVESPAYQARTRLVLDRITKFRERQRRS